MNIRGQIASLVALCFLASCAHNTNQPTSATWTPAQGTTRGVASDGEINAEKAKQNLDSGVGFGIGCSKVQGQQVSVWLDFYKTGADNAPITETYKDSYIKVADLLQMSNSVENVLPGTKNRIIDSGGYKYLVTPSAIRVLNTQNKSAAYIADIRGVLKSTCALKADLQEYGGENGFFADESYTPLSIVGPYISVHLSSSMYTGGAHPSSYQGYESRNVTKISVAEANKNTKVASAKYNLFEISSEADILAALKGDKYLQKKLGAGNLAATKDTTALHKLMVNKFRDSCDISIPLDKNEAFSQLAIFDYDAAKNNMTVRVGYSYGCEAARGTFTQLGLILKPTPLFASYLKAEVDSATAQGRKPYFMRYSQQLK